MDDELRNQISALFHALEVGEPVTPDDARARAVAAVNARRRHDQRRRRGVAAAAVVLLLATGGALVRSGLDDGTVTAGTPLPRDLDELADRVADLPTPVLGETADARYSYRRGEMMSVSGSTSEVISYEEQYWVALDGTGWKTTDPASNAREVGRGPAQANPLPPAVYLGLTDDVEAVAAALADHDRPFSSEVSPFLIDVLTFAGFPGPARAGMLRTLDRLGMVPVAEADPGPNLFRVEGPGGPDGLRLQADLDVRTGLVIAWEWYRVDGSGVRGGGTQFTVFETGLRRDTEGS